MKHAYDSHKKNIYVKFRYIANLLLLTSLLVKPNLSPATIMPLKYQTEVDAFSPTEEDWNEFDSIDDKKSFRWVFENPKDEKNFKPRYAYPEVVEIARKRNKLTYKGWALSFNETLEQSIAGLKLITRSKVELYKKFGTHIAEGVINSKDGITEIKCNEHGHFNHFEYEGTNFLADRFVTVKTVIEL